MAEAPPLLLLVDDDDAGRYATARILRREGFEVAEEGTGEGALQAVERYKPDLVLLDVNLPDLSGFEVCRRLKANEESARIPVLHLSATYLKPDAVVKGLEAADAYLTQPVEPAVLIATVRALLRIRRQDRELMAERNRFRVLAETAATAIFLYQGSRFVYVNPACVPLTGYSQEELVGMPFLRLIHPEDREMVRARAEARMKGEPVLNRYPFRIVTKEGRTRWVFFTAGRSEFEGKPAVIGTAIDITDQIEASERLKKSEETFRLLFQSHPHPVWVYDSETLRFLEVNDAAVEKYGYGHNEFLSMTIREIRPPEEVPRLEENLARPRPVLEHSGPWIHLLKDGRRIEVEIHSHTLTFEGRPAVLVVAEDVTEKLQARRSLEASERRFRTLVEASQEGIMAVDREGRVTFANRRMAELLGRSVEDLLGMEVFSLVHPEDRPASRKDFKARGAGRAEGKEIRFLRPDGGVVPTYSILAPLFSDAGEFEGVVGLHLDLRERKRLEAELQRAKTLETIGMVAGGVAHEVRNPLFALQTVAAALHKKLGGAEEYAEYLRHIQEQVDRLNALMTDLLHLGRPIPKEAFGEVDLWEVVRSAVGSLEARFPGAGERVEVKGADGAPKVWGARGNLLQVVENLLSNALSFSPEGEKVRVRLGKGEGEVTVEVEDRGPGIPEDLLGSLFTPFASRRKGGTGLGLAIVRKVVEAHGGTVEARNNDPPPGAAFTVRLPAAREAE